MARKNNKHDTAPVLDAAHKWIASCLIEDCSVFGEGQLWTLPNLESLAGRLKGKRPNDEQTGLEVMRDACADAPPDVRRLLCEVLWAVRLFPVTPGPETKLEQFLSVWEITGLQPPTQHAMLQDKVLGGIGSAGQAYLGGLYFELCFLIELARHLKALPPQERSLLFSDVDRLSDQIERTPKTGIRQFAHILRYFAFPDQIERIVSRSQKRKILKAFGIDAKPSWSPRQTDKALLDLRRRLETEYPNQLLDFYEAPLREKWDKKKDAAAAPEATAETEDDDIEDDEAETPETTMPINRIYYGPPGTGKTFALQRLLRDYTDEGDEQDRKTWILGLVADCRWRDVIAAALAEKGPMAAPAIRDHELVQAMLAKSAASTSQMIKNCLRHHTPPDLETVKTGHRGDPVIFTKSADSIWSLLPEWEQEEERLTTFVKTYLAGPSTKTPTKRYRTVTFHPSYCYEDFVRGIRPVGTEDEGRTEFRMVDGVFKQICDEARANPTKRYALFIDEINRGNIAKIFGELITLIEPDKRITVAADGSVVSGMTVQLPGSNTGEVAEPPFGVPANLDLYGTMNTADRSIALLDIALRRRFEFVEMPPRYDLNELLEPVAGVDRGALLRRINDRLEYLLDRDHRIGHAYLMKAQSLADLRSAFANQIIPLLQEYFFDDLSKVALTLSGPDGTSPFVRKEELSHSKLFAARSGGTSGSRFRYLVTDPTQWTAEAFQFIYASTSATLETEIEDAAG